MDLADEVDAMTEQQKLYELEKLSETPGHPAEVKWLQAIDDQLVALPELTDFNGWQKYRGKLRKASSSAWRQENRPKSHLSTVWTMRELKLYQQTMAKLFGESWQDQLLTGQAGAAVERAGADSEPEEQRHLTT